MDVFSQGKESGGEAALISLLGIEMAYERQAALEGVTLDVSPGDYLAVVGENGGGKTTLLSAILGLRAPSRGSVTLGAGFDRTMLGYLPQQSPFQRDFPASCMEVALSGCLGGLGLRPFYGREHKKRAEAALERAGVYDLRKTPYRELSGGQRQRVLFARALCAAERMIVLDEPTNGLDPSGSALIYETLRELNRSGVAVVMVSHDVASAKREAKDILHLAARPLYHGGSDGYDPARYEGGGADD